MAYSTAGGGFGSSSSYHGSLQKQMMMSEYNQMMGSSTTTGLNMAGTVATFTGAKKENIRVAVRVRPLLPHEAHRDEVVYYPTFEEGPLQVRIMKILI